MPQYLLLTTIFTAGTAKKTLCAEDNLGAFFTSVFWEGINGVARFNLDTFYGRFVLYPYGLCRDQTNR